MNRLQRFAGECRYDANMNMVRKTAGTTVTNHIHDIENRMIGLDMAADVGAADKAAIQLVEVQPYQLLVSDT